ncbi:MAG TPA: FHA domain-containing protein [Vicinamibacteria bacterium]|jgi:hypothetical protein|nr:FHA domain-containing protein [Vicinamibacteria bacterium]
MKFEIKYPSGDRHEVVLQGTMAVLGRDPTCDLVLSDVKCSRRHAVIEAGPDGLAIRDSGSANGVFVNGRKVERAGLQPGDLIRLGEVILEVLPEEVTGTVVMAPEDMGELKPGARARPVPPPKPSPPQREARPAGRASGAIPRPLTVTTLASLWLLSAVVYALAGLGAATLSGLQSDWAIAAAGAGLALAFLCGVMAFGLWSRSGWARVVQIGIAGLGLLTCAYTLASATILVHMLRGDVRIHFSGRQDFQELSPVEAETVLGGASADTTFALTILAMFLLGSILSAAGVWLAVHPPR